MRVFPRGEAIRFYRDFLGFTIDREHRFEPGLPLYLQVFRQGCVLHLRGDELQIPDPFGNRLNFHTPRP